MKSDTIQFGSFAVPLKEFASQGNAILGIRDSGKSYTATFLAERLLDYGIPFVAFDPIGVWRCLKVPGSPGLTGYNVVVAGEEADLRLTPTSAPNQEFGRARALLQKVAALGFECGNSFHEVRELPIKAVAKPPPQPNTPKLSQKPLHALG